MPAAVVSGSLAGVEWFRTATYKSLLVALALGFTGSLTIDNVKSRRETQKQHLFPLLTVRAGRKDSPEISTAFGQRKYHYRVLGCATQTIPPLFSYLAIKSLTDKSNL